MVVDINVGQLTIKLSERWWLDNKLSNYVKGDAAQLDRRQVQDDLEPDCCHLDEEEAVAAALPGFYIIFKSN